MSLSKLQETVKDKEAWSIAIHGVVKSQDSWRHHISEFKWQVTQKMFFWDFLAFLMIQHMLAIWPLVPLPFLNPAWASGVINIHCEHPLDHSQSKRVPEKHILLLYWLYQSLWLCGSPQNGKLLKSWEYQTTLPDSWEISMQVKKQQLELDMEQHTGFK